MNQIKFNGWDTIKKKMYTAEEMGKDELTINPDGRGFVNVNSTSTKLSQYLPHIIALQYVDQIDRMDKDIFEMDIVEHRLPGEQKRRRGVISISPSQGVLVGNYPLGFDIKVIGDLYRNPELMEVQE